MTDSLGDGNVLSRTCSGQTVRFHWTAESRLLALKVVGGDSVDLRYDAAGRLVRKDVNGAVQRYFLWQGQSLLAELNATATGKIAEYSYYPGLDRLHALITGTTPYYAHVDAAGNVIALTDSATQTVQRWYRFDAWGTQIDGADVKPFSGADRARFKGALLMGVVGGFDLYYMRNRWYETNSGRFLSEDPIGLEGGLNPYVFAGDDPVNFRDPTGEDLMPVDFFGTTVWMDCYEFRSAVTCYAVGVGGPTVWGEAEPWPNTLDAAGGLGGPGPGGSGAGPGSPAGQQPQQPDVGEQAQQQCNAAGDAATNSLMGDLGLLLAMRAWRRGMGPSGPSNVTGATLALYGGVAVYGAGQYSASGNSSLDFVPVFGSFDKLFTTVQACFFPGKY